jgi:hypothetical protein
VASEDIIAWIDTELAEADLMICEGSYDGEDYWRGWTDALTELKRKMTSGELSV